jgi:hypothetical protein
MKSAEANDIRKVTTSFWIVRPSRDMACHKELSICYVTECASITVVLKNQLSDAILSSPLSDHSLPIACGDYTQLQLVLGQGVIYRIIGQILRFDMYRAVQE